MKTVYGVNCLCQNTRLLPLSWDLRRKRGLCSSYHKLLTVPYVSLKSAGTWASPSLGSCKSDSWRMFVYYAATLILLWISACPEHWPLALLILCVLQQAMWGPGLGPKASSRPRPVNWPSLHPPSQRAGPPPGCLVAWARSQQCHDTALDIWSQVVRLLTYDGVPSSHLSWKCTASVASVFSVGSFIRRARTVF